MIGELLLGKIWKYMRRETFSCSEALVGHPVHHFAESSDCTRCYLASVLGKLQAVWNSTVRYRHLVAKMWVYVEHALSWNLDLSRRSINYSVRTDNECADCIDALPFKYLDDIYSSHAVSLLHNFSILTHYLTVCAKLGGFI